MKYAFICIGMLVLILTGCEAEPGQKPKETQVTKPIPAPRYPPTTVTDLRGLAVKGNASAIHEFRSESVGLTGVCPQSKRVVIVNPSMTGQQLAQDMLAYFYAQKLDNNCGSVVFVYHGEGEMEGGYTAGRVKLDVTDSNGKINLDPKASNLKHELTLNIGPYDNSQEYAITY